MAVCSSCRASRSSFGGLKVVSDLDLHVEEGEIVSVIGPNGAGKTTLFNLITGIYDPDEGDITLDGQSIVGLAAAPDQPARHLAHVPDAAALPEHVGQGERDGGRVRAHEGRRLPLDAAHAGHAPRGARDRGSSPRSGSRSSASG